MGNGEDCDALRLYKEGMNKFDLISPEKEKELGEIIQCSYKEMKNSILGSYDGAKVFFDMYNNGAFLRRASNLNKTITKIPSIFSNLF